MIRVYCISFLLLVNCCLFANGNCDDVHYQAIHDSIKYLNYAFQPEQALDLSYSTLEKELPKEFESCELYLWILYQQGLSKQLSREYDESISILYDLILLAKQNNYHQVEAESYLTIALVHEFIGQREECAKGLANALAVIEKYNVKESFPRFCVRSSSHNRIIGNNKLAKQYAKRAIESALEIGDTDNELDGNLLMGGFEKDPNEAIKYYERAAQLFYNRKGYVGAASQTLNASSVMMRANDPERSYRYMNKAYAYLLLATEYNKDYYSTLTYYLEKKKNYFKQKNRLDSALYYSEKYSEALPEQFTATNLFTIKETESKYHVELEQQKSAQIIKDAENLKTALYIGSFLLFLFGLMAYLINKNRTKIKNQNKLISNQMDALSSEKEKSDVLLSEIHHRVKNNLQNIISLILFKGNDAKTEGEQSILQDINSKIISLSSIHENLYNTGEFQNVNLAQYLDRYIANFISSNRISNINFTKSTKIDTLNIETMTPIGLLLSELLSTATQSETSRKGPINIHLEFSKENNPTIVFRFIQVDKPYPQEFIDNTNTSTGMNIIRSMSRQLRGNHTFSNDKNGNFELIFQEKEVSKI